MTVEYGEAREHVAELCDRVAEGRAPIRLTRHGVASVVLIAEDEYRVLLDTVHLRRSAENATRLHAALHRALATADALGDA